MIWVSWSGRSSTQGITDETPGTNSLVGGRCQDGHLQQQHQGPNYSLHGPCESCCHQGVVDEVLQLRGQPPQRQGGGGTWGPLEIGIPRPGEHWICLSATECGAVKGQEGGVKEVATYSAEVQGLHNTYFSWVEVICKQFFKTTAAALTCASHAAVLYFCFVLVECFGWQESASPRPSSPWNVGDFL